MSDQLRKAAVDVLKWHVTDTPARNSAIPNVYLEALRAALAEGESNCQGLLDSSPPSIDALIAEIDGIEVQVFEISSPPWTEEAYHKDDIKPILDKYRAKDKL